MLKGKYNSIASIEMIEAVGENYLDKYFSTIKDNRLVLRWSWCSAGNNY